MESPIDLFPNCKYLPSKLGMDEKRRASVWKQMDGFRRNGQFCDAVIQCRDGNLLAHKCVLSSVSPYLEALFTSSLKTCNYVGAVDFKEFSSEAVELLLEVVYSEVQIPSAHVVELLKLAEFICCNWLVEELFKEVRCLINRSNVFEWYDVARQCGVRKLIVLSECYIRENRGVLHWESMMDDVHRRQILNHVFNGGEYIRSSLLINDPHNQKMYVVDMAKNSCIPYQNSQLFDLLKGSVYTLTFIHNKVFYLLSCWHPNSDLALWKYHSISKSFELVKRLDLETLNWNLNLHYGCLYFFQAVYDNKANLYMYFLNRKPPFWLEPSQYPRNSFIVKFDLSTLCFYDGCVMFDEIYTAYKFFADEQNTYFVGFHFICNLDKFDFDCTDNRILTKEFIDPQMKSKKKHDYITKQEVLDEINEGTGSHHQAIQVTDDAVYWIFTFDYYCESIYHIYKFDFDKLAWVDFSAIDFHGVLEQFTFGSKLFCRFEDSDWDADERTNVLCYVEQGGDEWKPVPVAVPWLNIEGAEFFNVPEYIML